MYVRGEGGGRCVKRWGEYESEGEISAKMRAIRPTLRVGRTGGTWHQHSTVDIFPSGV
jgi:hypothetical protein